MSTQYESRADLEADIEEKKEDLNAFQEALDIIHDRLLRSQERSKSPFPIHKWSGAVGVRDVLEVIVHNMSRMKVEMENLRPQYPESRRPTLKLVE